MSNLNGFFYFTAHKEETVLAVFISENSRVALELPQSSSNCSDLISQRRVLTVGKRKMAFTGPSLSTSKKSMVSVHDIVIHLCKVNALEIIIHYTRQIQFQIVRFTFAPPNFCLKLYLGTWAMAKTTYQNER